MNMSAPAAPAGPRSRAAIAGQLLAVAGAGRGGRPVGHPRLDHRPDLSLPAGGAASVLGSLAVASIGRELDAPVATALVALAGAAMSVAWLRRGVADVIPPTAASGADA